MGKKQCNTDAAHWMLIIETFALLMNRRALRFIAVDKYF
jgi:hypothetical protein